MNEHKNQCRQSYQCDQCLKKSKSMSQLFEHIGSKHEKSNSPEPKKTKVDIEEEALKKMESLAVSENEQPKSSDEIPVKNKPDNMEIDVKKKRKRELSISKIKTNPEDLNKRKQDPCPRELPDRVKPLVEINSKEFVVKGDGPCLLRTTAAHVFGDPDEGPQLARDLNTHQAEYRPHYEEKISADFPFTATIRVNGETKLLQNSTEYFDWLQESQNAAYMWRGCVDVMAIANMANMDIDMIVYEDGSEPNLRHFQPDQEFPWNQEDPRKPIEGQ